MSVAIVEDFQVTFREDRPYPVKAYMTREGAIVANVRNKQALVQADFAAPGGITVCAYYEDESPVSGVTITPLTVASVIFDTLITGNTGPSTGWNFDYVVPASFFPTPTTTKNTVIEFRFTLSDGNLWEVLRLVGPVLSTTGS